jgi:all-trans-retinol 13,14-reductase
MAPPGHHVLEIATVCPYAPFKRLRDQDRKAYKAQKRAIYQAIMVSVRDLIPDVDAYARMKVYGTPTTSEHYLGQPQGNIYGAKLTPRQVGLHRLGYRTELPNLMLGGGQRGLSQCPRGDQQWHECGGTDHRQECATGEGGGQSGIVDKRPQL